MKILRSFVQLVGVAAGFIAYSSAELALIRSEATWGAYGAIGALVFVFGALIAALMVCYRHFTANSLRWRWLIPSSVIWQGIVLLF